MTICTLASSSSGNCTVISHGKTHLLIDAGISLRRIKENLRVLGLTPDDLAGVLVTHEHSDHIKGIQMLVKYHKTPVFSSWGAGAGIYNSYSDVGPCLNGFEIGADFELGDITVCSFNTPHDACESVGFSLKADDTTLAYVTDLGCITEEVMNSMRGADIAFIESNHDHDMLRSGPYPPYLKRRISSQHGHLSNSDCGNFAVELVKSGTRYLQLSHLSRENNTPGLASKTVSQALFECGVNVGCDVQLDVALPFEHSRVYEL
ncbi:MAG: MBL fold metallo-hydrolase [Oscillospiraceae bacterium]|nr:MBL fold metallo-hydrolase [Oscillospiraceae bacterium]